jgi:tRNA-splicing ligase RtcB (3'-phosphate/5'-hydroxy nucleic acid ligase)
MWDLAGCAAKSLVVDRLSSFTCHRPARCPASQYRHDRDSSACGRHADGTLCLRHRKGATRAFGPAHEELPRAYQDVGQPVLIPGSMGTASYVLAGTDVADDLSLSSACHGAGRAMSRTAARRSVEAHALRRTLEAAGLAVSCPSDAALAEEVPVAYKDVDRVVAVVEGARIAHKVARLLPLGVVKG